MDASWAARWAFRRRTCGSCGAGRRCKGSWRCAFLASTPQPLIAVASLGTRPTVDGTEMLLEVHVFDFAADLYGREIEVEFIAKLRDEVKFDSLDALIVQMKIDAAQARDLLTKVSCD